MSDIPDRLTRGYRRFREGCSEGRRSLFESLSSGQNPSYMAVSCADSRIMVSEIFDTEPGDVFLVRNIAGLVPAYRGRHGCLAMTAALEYAVCVLGVSTIIVLGHRNCGGIAAWLDRDDRIEKTEVDRWVGQLSEMPPEDRLKTDPTDVEQSAVGYSIRNLADYPFVKERSARGELSLAGVWVSLPEMTVYRLDGGKFIPI